MQVVTTNHNDVISIGPQVYCRPVTLTLNCVTAGNSRTQMFLTGREIQVQPHRLIQVPRRITPADQVNYHFMSKNAAAMHCSSIKDVHRQCGSKLLCYVL